MGGVSAVYRKRTEHVCGAFCGKPVFAAFSEILARVLKAPVILLLVPMLIPEIPGGDLYYAMYDLVQRHFTDFGNSANKVLMEAERLLWGLSWLPIFPNLSVIFSCT